MPKISSELTTQVRKGSEMTEKVLNSVRATLVKSCLGSNVGCWCFLVNSRSPVLTRNPLMRANFEILSIRITKHWPNSQSMGGTRVGT